MATAGLGRFVALGISTGRQRVLLPWRQSSRYVRFSGSAAGPSPSSNPATAGSSDPKDKKKSPHVSFYQVYGRAVSKVILMSLLVYQGIYYGWMWLEHLEVKHGKEGEIRALEEKIRELQRRATKLEEKKKAAQKTV